MQNQYFQNMNLNPLVKPVNELMDLNVKTIQKLSYVSPTDLLNIRKPEELLQKNMNVLVENTNTVMNYVKDVFNIWENNVFHTLDNMPDPISAPMKQAAKTAFSEIDSAIKKGESAGRQGMSQFKHTNKTMGKVVKSSVKKAAGQSTKGPSKAMDVKQAAKAVSKEQPKSSGKKPSTKVNKAQSVSHMGQGSKQEALRK